MRPAYVVLHKINLKTLAVNNLYYTVPSAVPACHSVLAATVLSHLHVDDSPSDISPIKNNFNPFCCCCHNNVAEDTY